MLPVAVARLCYNGIVISYVLPVFWLMLCFHAMGFVVCAATGYVIVYSLAAIA